LESPSIAKIGQNIKYDLTVLANYGLRLQGLLKDTMLAHYLMEPDKRHNMEALSESFLQYRPIPIEELIGPKGAKQGSIRNAPVHKVAEYAAEDADVTLKLKNKIFPLLESQGLAGLYEKMEAPLLEVLADMEREGVAIDAQALNAYSIELAQDIQETENEILEMAGEGFNIASPKQLGVILFEKLKLSDKPVKTKTGQYATNEETLAKLSDKHPIVNKILSFRELQKLKSTYVDALPGLVSPSDGLIHTSYNQAVAATGRLSSTNPNLQNIPIRTDKGREIRKAFVPRGKGFSIMSADYSQVELRIMAEFSQDEAMIQAFRDGRDIHTATAAKLYRLPLEEVDAEMRRKAKTANFGIIYGISAFGLSQRLNIPRKEASEIIDNYFTEFPGVKKYMDDVVEQAREKGYVETLFGRRRYLRDINSRNATARGFAERNAINAPIQGSAADIIKMAMIDIHRWLKNSGLRSKMIMQVHDELVFDVWEDEKETMKNKVLELMQGAAQLSVPLLVEAGFGENWLEAH
jgi:DNA polymerase-1